MINDSQPSCHVLYTSQIVYCNGQNPKNHLNTEGPEACFNNVSKLCSCNVGTTASFHYNGAHNWIFNLW